MREHSCKIKGNTAIYFRLQQERRSTQCRRNWLLFIAVVTVFEIFLSFQSVKY